MEIVPGIHQVDGVNGNCYVVDREKLIVIDTGMPGSGRKILTYIKDTLHRQPDEIGTIFLTHFHMDHTGGIAVLKKAAPKAKVAVHEAEAGYVSGKTALPQYPGAKGMLLHIVEKIMGPKPIMPDIILKDGDRVDGLLCVSLPGHTPGSTGLLDEGSKVFFSGDTLRFDGKSVGRGPAFFTMDLAHERESIMRIAGLDFDTLLVGHGVPLHPGAATKVREFADTLFQKEIPRV
jgi:glyoxylase-like metal-dependent hydrolase (beta-lactamase superfamily II)